MMNAQDVFSRIAAVGQVPSLSGVTASCRFDIEGAGSWLVTIRDGAVAVRRGARNNPDCTIAAQEEDFVQVAIGQRNTVTALMQGRVVFRGDPEMLPTLQQVFRAAGTAAEARPVEKRP